jgi:hypothetical protein
MEFAMNNSYHSGIRNTPFMLNYLQHQQDPVFASVLHKNPVLSKFLGNWDEQVSKAKQFCLVAQQRYKEYADNGGRLAPEYKPGDQVLQKNEGLPTWYRIFFVK